MEIGFLGFGTLGKVMSMNLLHHGFKVTIWNRTLSKCEEFVARGVSVGKAPTAIVEKYKYTITMLSDPSATLFKAIKAKGDYFLKALILGSKKPTKDGQLVILANKDKVNKDGVG
ncbi:hypothetical protein RJT34_24868 [Clitoria ternatea]|uniref:6-phosphogluconate dehydrogenase NADP-binding domain-containing protein n=1 Tax=Clitoria ternatea TaxID=43366 RepID=A0AAN9FUZ3_CLITE